MINNMKALRERFNMTQEELACATGISRKTIISIENGKTSPSLEYAYKIAKPFSVPVEEIFIPYEPRKHYVEKIRYVDVFCGIGGFRYAAENVFKKSNIPSRCVFSSDIDKYAKQSYAANFGHEPLGDITKISVENIPDHELLFAGFPCQPFSIIGLGRGFDDMRGTLFFEIARILRDKAPHAFVLENVKRLVSHEGGATFKKILQTLRDLDYHVDYKVLNALDYGLPQKRERVVIIGSKTPFLMNWQHKSDIINLSDILEKNVPLKYYASKTIVEKRKSVHTSKYNPSIWHENKAGNISSYPYSCALRANASYNYLLVNGERRLTPREMLRLQGFPDSFNIVVNDMQIRKQAGNAVPVKMIESVLEEFIPMVFAY